jgi:hypothetical protein
MAQENRLGFLSEGFELRRARDLSQDMTPVTAIGPAVYAFLVYDGDRLLNASGYFDLGGLPPLSVDGHSHLYTGHTYELARRLKNHLRGDIRTSTFRKSLLSIDAFMTRGQPIFGCADLFDAAPLTDWLATNGIVAFRREADPETAERDLLARTPSPLNITTRRVSNYARRLVALRCLLDGKSVPDCCKAFTPDWINEQEKNHD